ncbi:viroplasmin family protein [Duncaniella freteri]|jgi:ribonuclease HI|uniref:Ribonuclease H n=2 Tax=Duncaniella TaxID=2518495 RepID=A0A4Z0V675_9BACT|nr:ribonuclease H family protein [Duncaniella freteri]MDE7026981.1 ribonuclease H family protein [Duncaniella freteri]NBJ08211.1 ribonuclease H [Alistipes sp. Z76]NCE70219.1 ribonuclease H [Muribaculaceae bacterium M3]TGG40351.1 ribonuclease H [Duncaniella freteri]
MRKKFYVVWNGYATGVFDSWEECQLQTKGYPGAKYKSFDSQEAAVEAYRGDPAEQIELLASIAKHRPAPVNYESFPDIRLDSLAVDAACSKNPGPVEYQGVWVRTGERIFHVGPIEGGTNNIGEYLALVHGLALLKSQGRPNTPIYTDSRTARAWVRNRQPKTTLPRTPQNERLFEMIERATAWLNANPLTNPILTWDTPAWGEIPADFGRK